VLYWWEPIFLHLPFFGDCCQKEKTLVEVPQGKSDYVQVPCSMPHHDCVQEHLVVSQELLSYRKDDWSKVTIQG
jgi:hypothetical protein